MVWYPVQNMSTTLGFIKVKKRVENVLSEWKVGKNKKFERRVFNLINLM